MAPPKFKSTDDLLQTLDGDTRTIVDFLRNTILSADELISEHIKWNSVAFFYNGEIKEFDAKEYKRDILVINLHRGKILLVLPTGASIPDETGVLEGNFTDGRRIVTIENLADAQKKAENLRTVLKHWLKLVEK
jgi:hypothetical protein